MKCALIAAALALALVAGASTGANAGGSRPVVVELYTSQGCSSCPPADALLGKLAKQGSGAGVIPISLPITYWDMLGWKDSLASEANTQRQKAYAAAMGHGGVYTPQIIVDGAIDVVGSREDKVAAAIERARQASDAQDGKRDAAREITVDINLSLMPKKLHIVIAAAPPFPKKPKLNATIWLFHLRSSATVHIAAGENNGRTMTYSNVVTGPVEDIGKWYGHAVTADIPQSNTPAHDGVVVLVQQGGYGRVLGAAYLARTDYYASR